MMRYGIRETIIKKSERRRQVKAGFLEEKRQKHDEMDNLETELWRSQKVVRKRKGRRRPKQKDNNIRKA